VPPPRLEVTEHEAAIYCCGHCRATTTAAFRDGVNAHVQYGNRIRAAAVYCNVQQLIPEDRVCHVNAGVIFPKSAGVKFPTLAVSVVSR
jgi:transposase